MNKGQFKKLQPFEDNMLIAFRSGYYKNMRKSELNALLSVYKEITGEDISSKCDKCIVGVLKTLHTIYAKYKAKMESKLNTENDGK